jgi:hypothetical protein
MACDHLTECGAARYCLDVLKGNKKKQKNISIA